MYESFFNLTGEPFQLAPNAQFFFASQSHRRAQAYLRYGVVRAEGFIVITGDIGSGKSTLVQRLCSELESHKEVTAARVETTQMEAEDFLRLVVDAFGLSYEKTDKASLVIQLEDYLKRQLHAGKRTLLIVDEAQNLPMKSLEELRMLSNFQEAGTPLLQAFLLGQVQFQNTLASPELEQLRQRIIASCYLNPMSYEETQGYIEHRLNQVGWNGDPSFSPSAYQTIFQYSGGIPRRINIICDRLLLFAYLEGIHEITEETVSAVLEELVEESRLHGPDTTSAKGPWPASTEANRVTEDTRIAELEKRVTTLEDTLNKVRQLIQSFSGT